MELDPKTDLLSREQASVELGISLGTLSRLAKKGRIEVLRISPTCSRVARADLDRLKAELAAEARQ